jgi:hypothetical protein
MAVMKLKIMRQEIISNADANPSIEMMIGKPPQIM